MKYKIKQILCISLFFLIIGCTSNQDLKNVNKISEKLTVFEENGGSYSNNKIILIDGGRCVIEEEIIYDNEGKCLFLYTGGAEGLIQHSRNYIKGFLPLEGEQLDYNIRIDKKNNWILDNNDTIRVLKVLKDKIIVNIDSTHRFHVFKYK